MSTARAAEAEADPAGGPGGGGAPPEAEATPQRSKHSAPLLTGALLHQRWRVGKALGRGGFGTTYRGLHVETRVPVAIKVEHPAASRKHPKQSPLMHEINMYTALHPCPQLPCIEWKGVVRAGARGRLHVVVMQLLGGSLESLRARSPGGRLPAEQVRSMACQLLPLLRRMHTKGIVHRDIKPDNLMMGREENGHKVYMIDLGLAKRVQTLGEAHVPMTRHGKLTGSARYCSVTTHQGQSQSYKDDLESLAYTLLYLQEGALPWQKIGKSLDKKKRYAAIGEAKRDFVPPPGPAGWLLRLARRMAYGAFPPYAEIQAQFDARPAAAPEHTPTASSSDTWTPP